MDGVARWRLHLLRATYLLVAVGLALTIWPGVISPPADLAHLRTVVRSLLAGVGLLAIIGVIHPLRMLPLLLYELVWKSIWIVAFGWRRWSSGNFDGDMQRSAWELGISVVLFAVVIPWGHVWRRYLATVRRVDEKPTFCESASAKSSHS